MRFLISSCCGDATKADIVYPARLIAVRGDGDVRGEIEAEAESRKASAQERNRSETNSLLQASSEHRGKSFITGYD